MASDIAGKVSQLVHQGQDKLRGLSTEAIDQLAISASNKTMWGGVWSGAAGWLASVNWLGLAGFLIALAGLIANVYFMRRRDKREEAESHARIAAMKERCGL